MIPDDDKYLVTIEEMLQGADWDALSKEIQDNLINLRASVQPLRRVYGKPLVVSSGLRTMEKHLAIYKAKGITDKAKIPMKSWHLRGAAVDFGDSKREFQAFILKNKHLLEDCDLWVEDFSATRTWTHLQCRPYASWKPGKSRFFKP